MPLNKAPLELNGDFKYALDVLEKTGKSLFVTGRAGTGKSTLLQLFRRTSRKKMVVCAPTGIAALKVKGQTIHSLFGFPPRLILAKDIRKSGRRKWFKKIEVLVIDEISMVRADLLDAIDRSLRINRDSPLPFGGVQVVFIGDMFQLPPIVATEEEKRMFSMAYQTPYFFSANVMRGFDMEMLELRKVYRQENRHFLRLLDSVRLNQVDWEDLEDLNVRHLPNLDLPGGFITLSPRNAVVDRINRRELANLEEQEFTFEATVTGNFDPRLFPTQQLLRLKKGAQVMFIKNDPDGQFVNGTIGKVTELGFDFIKIESEEGEGEAKKITAVKMDWEIIKYKPSPDNPNDYEAEVVGTFNQYPLKLAWAVTIHKSQGKTFDRVIIDMGKGAFETGQTYVALSRCRTLEGIVLKQKLQPRDIMVDERVVEFYERNFI
ncbi:MAG TPA: AAA family ATPase [Bacteroidetes bacterium]|nr:AAA family ATPase [Bacteroidota bacterium]